MKRLIFFFLLLLQFAAQAQLPDYIYAPNIKGIKFSMAGNALAYPAIRLSSADKVELHFDDLNANVRNYSYTYILCNADWKAAILSSFDYIKGFPQMRITNYRISSIAFTKYTHYQAVLPENNCVPSRSGNYLLKVFADGDTSKVIFTKRLLVVDEKAGIGAQIQQPFNGQFFKSHQKIQFNINTAKLNLVNAMQQVNVCILQNNRWDNYLHNIKPTFMRPGSLEFNTETDAVFESGREWRWLDLRSFRLQSDRVDKAIYSKTATEIFIKPDVDRSGQRFVFYRDLNGMFYHEASESVNMFWQSDYATVHFKYIPPGNMAFANKDVYLFGELTNYGNMEGAKMEYNTDSAAYITAVFLKQGYYDYSYVTVDSKTSKPSFEFTEGNFWETENNYTILVYYRPLGGRADELIGYSKVNSLTARKGSGL